MCWKKHVEGLKFVEGFYYEEILWLFEILKAYFSAMDQVITESEFYHLDAITTVFHK